MAKTILFWMSLFLFMNKVMKMIKMKKVDELAISMDKQNKGKRGGK